MFQSFLKSWNEYLPSLNSLQTAEVLFDTPHNPLTIAFSFYKITILKRDKYSHQQNKISVRH